MVTSTDTASTEDTPSITTAVDHRNNNYDKIESNSTLTVGRSKHTCNNRTNHHDTRI